MTLLEVIVLAIIEGLTEFLPVSSTGHMIIGSSAMGIASEPFVKMFTVAIQFGAILSVLVLYWRRFFQSIGFYVKLFVAFLPAVFFGLLFKKQIDALLENIVVVALALIVGGIIFILLDDFFKRQRLRETSVEQDVTLPDRHRPTDDWSLGQLCARQRESKLAGVCRAANGQQLADRRDSQLVERFSAASLSRSPLPTYGDSDSLSATAESRHGQHATIAT